MNPKWQRTSQTLSTWHWAGGWQLCVWPAQTVYTSQSPGAGNSGRHTEMMSHATCYSTQEEINK